MHIIYRELSWGDRFLVGNVDDYRVFRSCLAALLNLLSTQKTVINVVTLHIKTNDKVRQCALHHINVTICLPKGERQIRLLDSPFINDWPSRLAGWPFLCH